MALQRQIVTIPFAQGLDTKTDPKQVSPGKLTMLQNGVFTTAKKIRKRYGTTAKPTSIFGGGSISSAQSVRSINGELVLMDGASLYSWSPGTATWNLKGALIRTESTRAAVVRAGTGASYASAAEIGNIRCLVWVDSVGLRFVLIDTVSGETIKAGVLVAGLAWYVSNAVRIAVLSGEFIVAYASMAGDVRYIALTTAGAAAAPVVVSASGQQPDIITSAGKIYFVYQIIPPGAAVDLAMKSLDGALTLSAETVIGLGLTLIPQEGVYSITLGVDAGTGNLMVLWFLQPNVYIPTSGSVGLSVVSPALAVVAAKIIIESGLYHGPATIAIPGTVLAAGTEPMAVGTMPDGSLRAWYTVRTTLAEAGCYYFTKTAVITGYAAGAITVLARAYLASTPATVGTISYVVLTPSDGTNRGRFMANAATGAIIARCATEDGYLSHEFSVPRLLVSGTTIRCPIMVDADQPGASVASAGFDWWTVTQPTTPQQLVEIGGTALLAGGLPSIYDGANVVEQGFNTEVGAITATATAGGTLNAGAFGFAAVYEWLDGSGAIHRSAPAFKSATTSAGNKTVTVVIPTLRLTSKTTALSLPRIVLYRTILNGTVYHLVSSAVNDPTVDTVTIVDAGTVSDTDLEARAILYTDGGVLDNQPVPPLSALTVYRNRAIGINSEQPRQLWYSKQVVPGYPVEFSDFLLLNLDPVGGDATGLAALDDKLIIFKAGVAYYVTGSGPDATGAQNDFSVPILINTNSGCIEPRSIITAADGVMYQSAKGFFILDRSLQDSYIGYGAESYNANSVYGVVQVPNTNEVRFSLSSDITLVYDFLFKQWSTFTGLHAVDSTIWGGRVHTLRSSGLVAYEDWSVFTDNGTSIALNIRTGWLGTGDLQSFLRVYKLFILGSWRSSHTLGVAIGYDYRSDVVAANTFIITATSDPSPSQFQWRVNLAQQKCEALQVWISDTGATGESLDLSGLSFEIGTKSGPMKLPATRSV